MLRIQGTSMAIKHTLNLFCISALSLTLISGCVNLPKQDNPLNKDENEKYFSSVDMAERFGILEYIQYKGTRLINAMARAGWSVRLYDQDNGIGGHPLDVIFTRNRDLRNIRPDPSFMITLRGESDRDYMIGKDGKRTVAQRKGFFTLDWYERESNLTKWLDGFNVSIESILKHQFEELRSLYIDYQYITRMETRYIHNNKNKLDRSPYFQRVYLNAEEHREVFYKPPVNNSSMYSDYSEKLNERLWYTHCFKMIMLDGTEEEKEKFRKGPISEPFVSEGYYDL